MTSTCNSASCRADRPWAPASATCGSNQNLASVTEHSRRHYSTPRVSPPGPLPLLGDGQHFVEEFDDGIVFDQAFPFLSEDGRPPFGIVHRQAYNPTERCTGPVVVHLSSAVLAILRMTGSRWSAGMKSFSSRIANRLSVEISVPRMGF